MFVLSTGLRCSVLCLTLLWVVGCVQTKPVPGYARAGDRIVLGLGGIERNSGGEAVLKASDLSITLTDASSVEHDLEALFVFKSFPDYAARLNAGVIDGQIDLFGLSGMSAFDGGWFVVVPLNPPGMPETPLPLAVGAATVEITSPKLTNIADAMEGDLSAIPVEIIAGTSARDGDYDRQFVGYTQYGDNFLIAPDNLAGVSQAGGAFLEIEYNDDSFFAAGAEPMVVPVDHNPYVQLNYNHVANGDGTGTLYVTLLNAAGFSDEANATQNTTPLSGLAVKLLYFKSGATSAVTQAKASFSINAGNSYYIGTDGSILTGISPVLTHNADL
ncbi:hypothetical protein [Candidatus Marimicrobium litorale]|uniref:DUF4382 domain-containing protein n=1 Tax=Candidatus Marimicrobium litorale TaxID=2518991 RepID=A0ABT3TBJ0_9GAMM|nr:hypothetical protein [Candidatus Marimicrobium litorale]MCX2979220.1 hypothetical protein [Candidatus Marimicrobium litorale]